ncbi:PFGI-1 class ICE element type IV pilus protein PilL2 [Gilliamella sp. ESL0250]|uniref:PFGI-1 class ICE element type IV pilus protein PilL2 n=1 Tax=Gilliamella sp. ESL0250 TaxID=2705036 RepID=UPI00157FDE95|nr:pilus assembly protein PilL [Gilliamella sp. ESL0250]NUF49565.1 pilus assembly protein PilL [Gilliamella sp. ESL0250]
MKIAISMLALLPIFVLTACTNNSKTITSKPKIESKPVLQTDRYTIVELDDPIHKYVLDQIINISLPKNLNLTVKDGMEYALKQSGYSLCTNSDINVLYESTLPKVQYKMGPILLNDALHIMAGPAWNLVVDDVEREICFQLKKGYFRKQQPISSVKQDDTYQTPPQIIETEDSKNTKHLNIRGSKK